MHEKLEIMRILERERDKKKRDGREERVDARHRIGRNRGKGRERGGRGRGKRASRGGGKVASRKANVGRRQDNRSCKPARLQSAVLQKNTGVSSSLIIPSPSIYLLIPHIVQPNIQPRNLVRCKFSPTKHTPTLNESMLNPQSTRVY